MTRGIMDGGFQVEKFRSMKPFWKLLKGSVKKKEELILKLKESLE